MDLSALGAHVDRCNGSRGPMFGLQLRRRRDDRLSRAAIRDHAVVIALVFGVASLVV